MIETFFVLACIILVVYISTFLIKASWNPYSICKKLDKEKFYDFLGYTLIAFTGFLLSGLLLKFQFSESERDIRSKETNILLIIKQEINRQRTELTNFHKLISRSKFIENKSVRLKQQAIPYILWATLPYIQTDSHNLNSFVFEGTKYIKPAWFWFYMKAVQDSLSYYQNQVAINRQLTEQYIELQKWQVTKATGKERPTYNLLESQMKHFRNQLLAFTDWFFNNFPTFATRIDTMNEIINCRIRKISQQYSELDDEASSLDLFFTDGKRIKWKPKNKK